MKKQIGAFLVCMIVFAFSLQWKDINAAEFSNSVQSGHAYVFKNVYSGLFLETKDNGITTSLYQNNADLQPNTIRQQFILVHEQTIDGTEYYSILPADNEQSRVDVNDASDRKGTKVKTFKKNAAYSQAQLFKFIDNKDGSYRIVPKLNERMALEVAGPSKKDFADIQIWDYIGADNQKWILIDMNDTPERQLEFYCEPDAYSKNSQTVDVIIQNNTDYNISFDTNYKVEKYSGHEWNTIYQYAFAGETSAFMPANTQTVTSFKVGEKGKETFEAGRYRIAKRFSGDELQADHQDLFNVKNSAAGYIYYAEFTIQ